MLNPASLTLYLVTDRGMAEGGNLRELVRRALAGGVTAVQIREKDTPGRDFYRLALELGLELAGTGIPFFINDRVDIAAAVPCAGVHLGQHDLPCAVARKILGGEKLIGISVSTTVEALEAEAQGADYLGAGPAFPTSTKHDADPVVGPAGLQAIAGAVQVPVIAIGGIAPDNVTQLNGIGLAGIAVVSAICAAGDPRRAAAELRAKFHR